MNSLMERRSSSSRWRSTAPLVFALALGCAAEARDEAMASVDSGILTTGPAQSSESEGDEDEGDPPALDVGSGQATAEGGDVESGCEKIDFLFVVDSSGSMEDEQANLVASFPKFIDTIRHETTATNYHIMVVDTDECDPTLGAGQNLECDEDAEPSCCENLCTTLPGATCNGAACSCPPAPDACHPQLGAGLVHDAAGSACGVPQGRRFMSASQADLEEVFSCTATVGTKGSGNEQTVDALLASLGPAMSSPGACNEGFARDDALLVVTVITDEEDDPEPVLPGVSFGSSGNPNQWYQSMVDLKNGNPKGVVLLSLVGPPAPDACPPLNKAGNGIVGAEVATRLIQLTELFEFGFVGPVCAPDFDPFFEEAVQVIEQACDEFVPPG